MSDESAGRVEERSPGALTLSGESPAERFHHIDVYNSRGDIDDEFEFGLTDSSTTVDIRNAQRRRNASPTFRNMLSSGWGGGRVACAVGTMLFGLAFLIRVELFETGVIWLCSGGGLGSSSQDGAPSGLVSSGDDVAGGSLGRSAEGGSKVANVVGSPAPVVVVPAQPGEQAATPSAGVVPAPAPVTSTPAAAPAATPPAPAPAPATPPAPPPVPPPTAPPRGDAASRFMLAQKESMGFFSDIDSDRWHRYKVRCYRQRYLDASIAGQGGGPGEAATFYQIHFPPSFTCAGEERIGPAGDGGKWLCDPWRVFGERGAGRRRLEGAEGSDVGERRRLGGEDLRADAEDSTRTAAEGAPSIAPGTATEGEELRETKGLPRRGPTESTFRSAGSGGASSPYQMTQGGIFGVATGKRKLQQEQDDRGNVFPTKSGRSSAPRRRLGSSPDSGTDAPLIYSVGSSNDWRFEEAILARCPHCEIHTFDHTIWPEKKPAKVNFHSWGLRAQRKDGDQSSSLLQTADQSPAAAPPPKPAAVPQAPPVVPPRPAAAARRAAIRSQVLRAAAARTAPALPKRRLDARRLDAIRTGGKESDGGAAVPAVGGGLDPYRKNKYLKHLQEIVSELKHENRVIDILKIDCEKCEWDVFPLRRSPVFKLSNPFF